MKVRIIVDNGYYFHQYFCEDDCGYSPWKPILYLRQFAFNTLEEAINAIEAGRFPNGKTVYEGEL